MILLFIKKISLLVNNFEKDSAVKQIYKIVFNNTF